MIKTTLRTLFTCGLLSGLLHGGPNDGITQPAAPDGKGTIGADLAPPPPDSNPLSFFNGVLTFDFQERLRFEDRNNNYDFNSKVKSVTDGSWLLDRTRLGMNFSPTDTFTFYVQGQSSYEFGDNRGRTPGVNGAEGNDPANLHQAYIQIGPKDFDVTIGRQILSYGDERLVGGFDWNNLSRVFDAVKLHYAQSTWSVDVFASSVVQPTNGDFDESDIFDGTGAVKDQIFSGIYFTSTGLIPVQTTDFYVFDLYQDGGGTDFVTLGTRMKADPTKLGGLMYETEMAAQLGKVLDRDLTAFAGHWALGYAFLDSSLKPSLSLEYNYATGGSAKGTDHTFQNLFPTNHLFYGNMDLFSWQNMQETALSFIAHPTDTLTTKLSYQADWLATTSDAWYRANGTTQVRPIDANASPFLGTEADVTVTWKATKNLAFQVGYSHFFTGDYLKATGANSPADFTYMMMTINF